jgi:hypothetical protein
MVLKRTLPDPCQYSEYFRLNIVMSNVLIFVKMPTSESIAEFYTLRLLDDQQNLLWIIRSTSFHDFQENLADPYRYSDYMRLCIDMSNVLIFYEQTQSLTTSQSISEWNSVRSAFWTTSKKYFRSSKVLPFHGS